MGKPSRLAASKNPAIATAARRGGRATPPAAAVDAPRDLDNARVQEEIQNPKPLEVTIGGKPIMLYPLPAQAARQFAGLFAQVLGEATARGTGATAMRVAGVLIENSEYTAKFSSYVARATFPTELSPSVPDLAAETARIDREATYAELVALFAKMSELNRINEVFAPK